MIRYNIIFYLLLTSAQAVFCQNFKFGWIQDLKIGNSTSINLNDSLINLANKFDDLKFIFVSGDLTSRGKNSEFQEAKVLFDKLKTNYYVIPGKGDFRWIESGGTILFEVFKDDKFSFEIEGVLFLGINTNIPRQKINGHVSPENLRWLRDQLSNTPDSQEVVLMMDYLPGDIDNNTKLINCFAGHNLQCIFAGSGESIQLSQFNNIPVFTSGQSAEIKTGKIQLSLVEYTKESITVSEAASFSKIKQKKSIKKKNVSIPFKPAPGITNYSAVLNWDKDLQSSVAVSPMIYKNKIYVFDKNGLITCFNKQKQTVWEYDAFGDILSEPAARDNLIAAATIQGDLITLNTSTGESSQIIGFDRVITSGIVIFPYEGDKQLMIPKTTNSNSAVLLGTSTGAVFCYDLETLEEIWKNESPGDMIICKPLVQNNKIIFTCLDGYLYCLDARDGLLIWKWKPPNAGEYDIAGCSPVSDGQKIYITSTNGHLYSVDLLLGKTVYQKNSYNAYESLLISEDKKKLFIKSSKDKIYAVNSSSGSLIKEIRLDYGEDMASSQPILYGSGILVGSRDGCIYFVDKNYKVKKIIFMGNSPVHTIKQLDENTLIAINYDGLLISFGIK